MRVSQAFTCYFAPWRLHTLNYGVDATNVEHNGRFQHRTNQSARARAGSSVSLYCIYIVVYSPVRSMAILGLLHAPPRRSNIFRRACFRR